MQGSLTGNRIATPNHGYDRNVRRRPNGCDDPDQSEHEHAVIRIVSRGIVPEIDVGMQRNFLVAYCLWAEAG